jgi:hypothetical protein
MYPAAGLGLGLGARVTSRGTIHPTANSHESIERSSTGGSQPAGRPGRAAKAGGEARAVGPSRWAQRGRGQVALGDPAALDPVCGGAFWPGFGGF